METTPHHYRYAVTSFGRLLLVGSGDALVALHLVGYDGAPEPDPSWSPDEGRLDAARNQLCEYFRGERTTFDLAIRPAGTDFQRTVWSALQEIPYGETTSYGELAAALGRPGSARAVGAANGRNPIAIVVPCHRVVGKDGSLVGYGGGLARKRWLLDHELRSAGVVLR
jgi:methylated-DNA-[protein]-cysteine S-methyltransferase